MPVSTSGPCVPVYGVLAKEDSALEGMVPLRAVYHVKGSFTLDNVKYASKSFPFDVHYASAVFESWEEIDNLM